MDPYHKENLIGPDESPETVTILQGQVTVNDPHVSTDDRDKLSILFSLYDSLMTRDDGGGFTPSLAHSWQISDDLRTWNFSLRRDVRFHDGEILDAEDVVASLDRVRDPSLGGELGTHGVYRSYLGGARIEAVDRHIVRVTTTSPMADLLDLLTDLPIAPQRILDDLPQETVGSGPYRLTDYTDGRIVMDAFEDHWGGPPQVRRLVWRRESDIERRIAALIDGDADLIADVHPGDAESRSSLRSGLVTRPSSVCTVFMCNLVTGCCTDKRVRQALNYAIDVRQIINEVMGGAADTLSGPLTRIHFGHDPQVPPFAFNPDRARRLLAAADTGGRLDIVLNVPTTLPDEATQVAQIMAEQYGDVGISTTIENHADRPAYAEMVREGRMRDAACFDSSPLSTWRILREKFHSGLRGPWWLGYENPEVDALIDQAEATITRVRRRDLYRRAFRIIRNDAPWIFLYNASLGWGVAPRLAGWQPSVDGRILMGRK